MLFKLIDALRRPQNSPEEDRQDSLSPLDSPNQPPLDTPAEDDDTLIFHSYQEDDQQTEDNILQPHYISTQSIDGTLITTNSLPKQQGKCRSDYEFSTLLGEGSLGRVYEAVRTDTGESVALKVVKKSRLLHSPMLCRMVREEVRILSKAAIIRNPFIVKLLCSFQDEAYLYYAFELVKGGTLTQLIERLNAFRKSNLPIVPLEIVRLWMSELLSVVWTLNDQRIVHRDLKPDNILVAKGHLRVIDFNHALIISASDNASFPSAAQTTTRETTSELTDTSREMAGTIPWWAPERVHLYLARSSPTTRSPSFLTTATTPTSKPNDRRCPRIEYDLWSLGCIMYEMLTGRNPFLRNTPEGTADRIMRYANRVANMEWSQRLDVLDFPAGVGPLTRDLCLKLLEPIPSKRAKILPASYSALLSHPFFSTSSFRRDYADVDPEDILNSLLKEAGKAQHQKPISASLLEFTPEIGQAFKVGRDESPGNTFDTVVSRQSQEFGSMAEECDTPVIPATPVFRTRLGHNQRDTKKLKKLSSWSSSQSNARQLPPAPEPHGPPPLYPPISPTIQPVFSPKLVTATSKPLENPEGCLESGQVSIPLFHCNDNPAGLRRNSLPRDVSDHRMTDESQKGNQTLTDGSGTTMATGGSTSHTTQKVSLANEPAEINETKSSTSSWAVTMSTEVFRDFVIPYIVTELHNLILLDRHPAPTRRSEEETFDEVTEAAVLTWGPLRLTIVQPIKSLTPWTISKHSLTIDPLHDLPEHSRHEHSQSGRHEHSQSGRHEHSQSGRYEDSSQTLGREQPPSRIIPQQILCCVRSPSYLMFNRIKRWLTPVNTPHEQSPGFSPPSLVKDLSYSNGGGAHDGADNKYPNRTKATPYSPWEITCFGVLSEKFGLLLFVAEIANEQCTLKYILQPSMSTTVPRINVLGSHRIEIETFQPDHLTLKATHQSIQYTARRAILDIGTPESLHSWLPGLQSIFGKVKEKQ